MAEDCVECVCGECKFWVMPPDHTSKTAYGTCLVVRGLITGFMHCQYNHPACYAFREKDLAVKIPGSDEINDIIRDILKEADDA